MNQGPVMSPKMYFLAAITPVLIGMLIAYFAIVAMVGMALSGQSPLYFIAAAYLCWLMYGLTQILCRMR